jgi:orotate phosphoribosyltransferase-like protein
MLRKAKVLLSTGKTAGEVCRELNISEQTYYKMEERKSSPEGRGTNCLRNRSSHLQTYVMK